MDRPRTYPEIPKHSLQHPQPYLGQTLNLPCSNPKPSSLKASTYCKFRAVRGITPVQAQSALPCSEFPLKDRRSVVRRDESFGKVTLRAVLIRSSAYHRMNVSWLFVCSRKRCPLEVGCYGIWVVVQVAAPF